MISRQLLRDSEAGPVVGLEKVLDYIRALRHHSERVQLGMGSEVMVLDVVHVHLII